VASLVLLLCPLEAAAQDKPIKGPKKICFMYSSFDLPAGQSLTGFTGSVESMRVKVRGPGAGYAVAESELFAAELPRDGLVATYGTTSIYRYRDGERVNYRIYGPSPFAGGGERQFVVLSGPVFTGGKRDAEIYSRFRIVDPEKTKCDHRFIYGWDTMLPDVPN